MSFKPEWKVDSCVRVCESKIMFVCIPQHKFKNIQNKHTIFYYKISIIAAPVWLIQNPTLVGRRNWCDCLRISFYFKNYAFRGEH